MERRYLDNFHIAGFSYYDGAIVFERLKVGKELTLKLEKDNRYDENAVALYYKKHKLGFIPSNQNKFIAEMLRCGVNVFDARVQQMSPKRHPEAQVKVVIHTIAKETN